MAAPMLSMYGGVAKTPHLQKLADQGVMSQVKRAAKREKFIVFLGWEPHPMNTQIKMNYLTGGDEYFGPDFGGATVQTVTRNRFSKDCPNLGSLLENVSFTLDMENQVMNGILEEGLAPEDAALTWLKANPTVLEAWLDGITTLDGQPGLAAVQKSL